MKIRLVGSKMFHADRQIDMQTGERGRHRNDEANSRFSQIFAKAHKSYDLRVWYKFSRSHSRTTLQHLSNVKPSRRLIMGFETPREASNVS